MKFESSQRERNPSVPAAEFDAEGGREPTRRPHRDNPRRSYVVAIVRHLQAVPKRTCVVKEVTEHPTLARGMQVLLKRGRRNSIQNPPVGGADPDPDRRMVQVTKLHETRYIPFKAALLQPVTSEDRHGEHYVMEHCGDYMQYGVSGQRVHGGRNYNPVDEIDAICPRTTIDQQVCLVPDAGGCDPLGRQRFFWYHQLYQH